MNRMVRIGNKTLICAAVALVVALVLWIGG